MWYINKIFTRKEIVGHRREIATEAAASSQMSATDLPDCKVSHP
jgi:hypothetical protein